MWQLNIQLICFFPNLSLKYILSLPKFLPCDVSNPRLRITGIGEEILHERNVIIHAPHLPLNVTRGERHTPIITPARLRPERTSTVAWTLSARAGLKKVNSLIVCQSSPINNKPVETPALYRDLVTRESVKHTGVSDLIIEGLFE